MADTCTKVNRKRLNELAARTGLHTPDLTPLEQQTAWMKAIPEATVNLPLVICIIEAMH